MEEESKEKIDEEKYKYMHSKPFFFFSLIRKSKIARSRNTKSKEMWMRNERIKEENKGNIDIDMNKWIKMKIVE